MVDFILEFCYLSAGEYMVDCCDSVKNSETVRSTLHQICFCLYEYVSKMKKGFIQFLIIQYS
jgi:hypothetical protein